MRSLARGASSVVHSLVEYTDGSTLAQLGPPDMRTPIACAWSWPDRIAWPAPKLDLAEKGPAKILPCDRGEAQAELHPHLAYARPHLVRSPQAPDRGPRPDRQALLPFLAPPRRHQITRQTTVSHELMKFAPSGFGQTSATTWSVRS